MQTGSRAAVTEFLDSVRPPESEQVLKEERSSSSAALFQEENCPGVQQFRPFVYNELFKIPS